MQENKPTILSTRPLAPVASAMAMANGILLQEVSLINTTPFNTPALKASVMELALHPITVAFTSMNAVEAVIDLLDQQRPDWHIYCLGNTTKQLIEAYFGAHTIKGTGNNATELAENIIADNNKEIVFFCGEQRRHELPQLLEAAGIQLQQHIVYSTTLTPRPLPQQHAGILFFSPSTVKSYFVFNQPAQDTVLFAIGQTTAATLRAYTTNRIITANAPDKQTLFEMALDYLTNTAPLRSANDRGI